MSKGEIGIISCLVALIGSGLLVSKNTIDPRAETEGLGGSQFMIFTDPPEAEIVQLNYTGDDEHKLGLTNKKVLTVQDFLKSGEEAPSNWEFKVRLEKEGFESSEQVIAQAETLQGKWPPVERPVIKMTPATVGSSIQYLLKYHPLGGALMGLSLLGLLGSVFLAREERRKRRVLLRYESDPGKDPYIGTYLQKHFVIERLGKGASGSVYKALDEKTLDEDSPRALKIINYDEYNLEIDQQKTLYEESKERFLREMEMLATSDHENIYNIFDFGREESYDWVVMPCYERNLSHYIDKEKPTQEKLLSIAKQIAAGLFYTHERGVGHRDLKPDNIMLDGDQVKIIDFGLAKIRDKKTITQLHAIMGTPKYMAPEQTTQQLPPNFAATDQFSYGLILFRLVSGEHAYPDPDDPLQTIVARQLEEPKKLRDVDGNQTEALEAVFTKMLARHPDERYPDIMKAYKAFEAAFKGSA